MDSDAGPALRVVGGGEPDPEELAALVVALTPTGGGADDRPPRRAGWRRAATLEGLGARPATSPADLDVTSRHG